MFDSLMALFKGTKRQVVAEPFDAQTWAQEKAAVISQEEAPARWAMLESKWPQTFKAMNEIARLRPDMTSGVELHRGVLSFTLSIPGHSDAEISGLPEEERLRRHYPVQVRYNISEKRVFGAGWAGGSLSDSDAAKYLWEAAEQAGYIKIERTIGLNGKERTAIVAGETGLEKDRPKPHFRVVGPENAS